MRRVGQNGASHRPLNRCVGHPQSGPQRTHGPAAYTDDELDLIRRALNLAEGESIRPEAVSLPDDRAVSPEPVADRLESWTGEEGMLSAASREAFWQFGRKQLKRRRVRAWAILVLGAVLFLAIASQFPETSILPQWGRDMGAAAMLAVFLAALCCEYVDSSLGMGYGTTLTPILLLVGFEPLQIVPAVLLSEFVTGLCAAALHHRDGNVDFLTDRKAQRTAILLSVLSVVGALAAVTVALSVPKFWLKLIIAVIILSVGMVILATIHRRMAYRRSHIIALGAVAAFNKGLSGGGYGPLVTGGQVVSGVTAKHAVAITSLAEGLTCFVGLSAYLLITGTLDWGLAVPLTLGALLSVPMATLTVRRLPESFMRASIGVVTCLLGALTLVRLFWD